MKITSILSVCALLALAGCSSEQCKKDCAKCECVQSDSTDIVLDLHRNVKPECVAAFKASFAECKKSTLEEQGCIDYGVYQSPEDSTRFFIHEQWSDMAALEAHWQTPHLKKHTAETADMYTSASGLQLPVCPCAKDM